METGNLGNRVHDETIHGRSALNETVGETALVKSIERAPNRLRKPGAPKENLNGAKHYLSAGGWPADATHDRRLVAKFGRVLRDEVLAAGGKLDIMTGATIQTVLRWERHARLAARWLRREGEKMEPAERLHFSKEVAMASERRDKAMRLLRIGEKPGGFDWPTVDASSVEAADGTTEDSDE